MTPRTSLRPPFPRTSAPPTTPRSSLAPASARAISGDPSSDRSPFKRTEAALATAAVAGIVEAIAGSWIVAIAARDLLVVLHADVLPSAMPVVAVLARLGLVVAEGLGALAVSVAACALFARIEARAAARETVPFWTRVVAVVRIVGGAIVFGGGWKLGWSTLLDSRAPWLLPVLAAAQLVALVLGSFRPNSRGSPDERRSPSTPARASGKQSA